MMHIFWDKISNYSERVPHEAAAQEAEAHNQFHRARATGNGSRRRSATTAIAGAAALAGAGLVLLLALLGGCAPSSSSGSNGNGGGPTRPMAMTIGEEVDCTTNADTVCTFDVGDTFEGGKSDAADDGDWIQVALAATTTYRIGVDPAGDSTMATVTIYNPTATAATPIIGSDMLWTATDADTYYIGVVLDAVGEYTLTIAAAPEGTNSCSSMDAEADCDGDSVANADDEFDFDPARSCTVTADTDTLDCDNDGHTNDMDNCPAVANPQQTNSDSSDGDVLGDACDIDLDNDGLIEIANLDALNNIRYNLAGTSYKTSAGDTGSTSGAPMAEQPACADGDSATTRLLCGYELTRSLNFATAADYDSGMVNMDWRPDMADATTATNAGWQPLGHDTDSGTAGLQGTAFGTILEGNGNTITNLYINRTSEGFVGLIGNVASGGTVRNLGLVDVFVVGDVNVGGLAGNNQGMISTSHSSGSVMASVTVGGLVGNNDGTIVAGYSSGSATGTGDFVGGLVGNNDGIISASYSRGSATSGDDDVGGLVGLNDGSGIISASYSSGSATADDNDVGGLVGWNNGGIISASYSSGSATSTSSGNNVGGLVGNGASTSRIATSYWDTTTSGRTFGVGSDDSGNDNMAGSGETNRLAAQGLTTAQMRASSTTFPDFSTVVKTAGSGTVAANLLGDFSAAWDYTANCYPRLKRWTGAGTDGVIGTNDDAFHASELLPGQGTPGTGGACTTS